MECVYDTGENKQSIYDTKCFIHRTRVSYVINNFSRSTKLRVVFDGPAKTTGGVSNIVRWQTDINTEQPWFDIEIRLL